MQNMPPKGIAVVFTDHQTKNYNLESDINSLRNEKNLDVIVVLAPKYSGSANDASCLLEISERDVYLSQVPISL